MNKWLFNETDFTVEWETKDGTVIMGSFETKKEAIEFITKEKPKCNKGKLILYKRTFKARYNGPANEHDKKIAEY